MPGPDSTAERRAQMPQGTQLILNARSLESGHRRLAALLKPGMAVLDIGCGTGAITRDIAAAVVPGGRVVGIDRNAALIDEAQSRHGADRGLSFVVGSIYDLPFRAAFDIVNAARVLQWLLDPVAALRMMVAATRPGGRVIVLDYNHEKIFWGPPPPPSMQTFYTAFLRWRETAGMDNAIADRLAEMLAQVGLEGITVSPQSETTTRTDADFTVRCDLWAEVAAGRGRQMVADGAISESDRALAEGEYRAWVRTEALSQTLYLLSVEGTRRPDA